MKLIRYTSVWSTDQLVGEVMRELELAPGHDPASQKAMQLANARCLYFNPLQQSWPCSPQRAMLHVPLSNLLLTYAISANSP